MAGKMGLERPLCPRHCALILMEHRTGSRTRIIEGLFGAKYRYGLLTEAQAVSYLVHKPIPSVYVGCGPLANIAVERFGDSLEGVVKCDQRRRIRRRQFTKLRCVRIKHRTRRLKRCPTVSGQRLFGRSANEVCR